MKQVLVMLLIALMVFAAVPTYAGSCGDTNDDGRVNVSDAVFLISYIFRGGAAPDPLARADVNYDGRINVSDAIYIINYIFKYGPSPSCPPFSVLALGTTAVTPEVSATITSYDTSGTFTSAVTSGLANFEVGNIIMGQNSLTAPSGYLRKITGKTIMGDSVILETQQATLPEAFTTLYVKEGIELSPVKIRSAKMMNGVTLSPNKHGNTFDISLNCILFDQDGDTLTNSDQTRLNGTDQFTATLYTTINVINNVLRLFESTILTIKTVNVNVVSGLTKNFDQGIDVTLAEFQMAAIPVGSVWVEPTLIVKARIQGNVAKIETGVRYSQDIYYGFNWTDNVFTNINQNTQQFTYIPPTCTSAFDFTTAISLDAACRLYGVQGQYLNNRSDFRLQSLSVNDTCGDRFELNLDVAVNAHVGIANDSLGLTYNQDFQLYAEPIGAWRFYLGSTGTVSIATNQSSASWTVVGPCGDSISGHGDSTVILTPGEIWIIWGAISGLTTPTSTSQTLSAGQTVTFLGTYVPNTVPTLVTDTARAINTVSAQSGGTITFDGGTPVLERGVCWSPNPNPTVANNKTTDGVGAGHYSSTIIDLTAKTLYYVRAYATNNVGTGYGNEISFTSATFGTMTDIDGNVYKTIIIGTQEWMAENLKVTHYRDGTPIPNLVDSADWRTDTLGAYVNYDNDTGYAAAYGHLYNWWAVSNPHNIAPAGWHVPSDDEWVILVNRYGGYGTAGGALKETGTNHWQSPNYLATNISGFSGRGGGRQDSQGVSVHKGTSGFFWNSTPYGDQNAYFQQLLYGGAGMAFGGITRWDGYSVRLVKDPVKK